jgi:diacylglycerol kinase family enzyme
LEYKDKKRRFAVSSGLGFDAAVCHRILVSKLKLILNKIGLGKLTYVAIALQSLLAQSPKPLTLTFDDGREEHFDKAYFVAGMNQKYEGGGFKFCPKADPSDDILDVMVASDISKLKVLCLLPTAYKGWHVHVKGIYTYQCKYVDIQSEIALPVHTDGEPIFLQRKARLGLEPEKLRLILS